MKYDRKFIGEVFVDSGGIVIVDPGYLLGSDIEDGGKRNYAFWGREEYENLNYSSSLFLGLVLGLMLLKTM